MKFLKYLLPLVVALSLSSAVHAQEHDNDRFEENLNERDFHILRDYVYTKRTINLEEKDWNLAISGDIRTEWRHLNEKRGNHRLRGKGAIDENGKIMCKTNMKHRHSRNDFDIQFNLRFDYVCDRSWGVAQLEFDNSAGVDSGDFECKDDECGWFGSGRCDNICLKKAYMGYNVCCECDTRLDIELGRRRLYDVLDSEIQFLSRFDGILIRYSTSFEYISDVYWNILGFVVDEKVNQFAYATEVGFLNILDTGFDLKYSFIDWTKNGRNRCFCSNPRAFKYRVSQWTMYYHFDPELFCAPVEFYAAGLYNHSASRLKFTHNGKEKESCKQPWAWYVGVTYGDVVREGDYAIDIQYQWVQAQAMPDQDSSGIGRGNVFDETLFLTGRGNTNFQGWKLEGLYALTDNLTLDSIIEHSVQLNQKIGGRHNYSKFEIEAIYAF